MTPVMEGLGLSDSGRGTSHVYVEISPYDKHDQLFHNSYDFSGPQGPGEESCFDPVVPGDANNNHHEPMEAGGILCSRRNVSIWK